MQKPNFNNQILTIINNPETSIDDLKAIEPIMRENCNSSIKQFYNYYLFTIILIIIWFLINNSVISEVKLFDMQINNVKILLLTIPLISILCYYLTISYLAFNQIIDAGLKKINEKIYPSISKTSLLELIVYPSFIELESIKVRLSNESFMSTMGFLFISLVLIFFPIIANSWICIILIKMYYNSWLILLPIFYSLIIYKIIKNLVFYFKQVQ